MSAPDEDQQVGASGLSERQAKTVELTIIALCLAALIMIFQPFSLTLFSVGAGLVVLGGLAFNLIPLCRPGVTPRALVKVVVIIFIILAVVIALGFGTAQLYVWYLGTLR